MDGTHTLLFNDIALDDMQILFQGEQVFVGRGNGAEGFYIDRSQWSNIKIALGTPDAVIERSLEYSVTFPTSSAARALAQASVTYTHPVTRTDEICAPTPRYGDSYDELAQRCYFAYVRLYVPGGSALVDITGVEPDSITSQRGEKGTQLFAGYLRLKPGESRTVVYAYQLPSTIAAEEYSLHVQRQSGTPPLPAVLHLGGETLETTIVEGRWQGP